jgi:hypothetical protein
MVSNLHADNTRQRGRIPMTIRSNRQCVLVVSASRPERERPDTIFVGTPLEVITLLENDRDLISTVILAGRFAKNRELAKFLTESYPALSVVAGRAGEEPDSFLPVYG